VSEYTDRSDDPEYRFYMPPEERAEDMLLNAELRIGGQVGVGTAAGTAYLKERGWIGPSGCLSAKGLACARALQNAYWGER
jgi:hypothetical protein